jgi:hypothetical protein
MMCRALTALLLTLAATHASADVYKWADERGMTVISNIPPADPAKVTQLEVVLKEAKAPQMRPTEQMLLDRIERLERQVVAQESPREQVVYRTPYPGGHYGSYYAAPPPPPPPAYTPDYYPPYNPYNYYYPYGLPYFPAFSTVVVGSRTGFRHHYHHHRHGGFTRFHSMPRGRR